MNKIFTIGYAGIKLTTFIEVLKENKISFLIDVRSVPRSQYFPAFNDKNIQGELLKNGIEYSNFKNEFGARQYDKDFYTNGVLNFEKFSKSKQFQNGIKLIKDLTKKNNICLMCAEIDPLNCHRAILIAKEVNYSGFEVVHIIAKRNGEITYENHTDLEKRLLETYKKQTDNLQIAYQKHNAIIGHKKDSMDTEN